MLSGKLKSGLFFGLVISMVVSGNAFAGKNGKGFMGGGNGGSGSGSASSTATGTPTSGLDTLSAEEQAGLLLMREEEKLARDVYLTMYDLYGAQVFANISNSEQSHMNAMKRLLDSYGIADPIVDDTTGVFVNTELAELYEALISSGSASLVDALKVGATIEDLDIKDLEDLIGELDGNADIARVYDNLLRGSRNHLRAFDRNLLSNGATYEPQFISQAEYDEIVNSATERGRNR